MPSLSLALPSFQLSNTRVAKDSMLLLARGRHDQHRKLRLVVALEVVRASPSAPRSGSRSACP
jgi:hypothetical protein